MAQSGTRGEDMQLLAMGMNAMRQQVIYYYYEY
jgi:hypothetical protein